MSEPDFAHTAPLPQKTLWQAGVTVNRKIVSLLDSLEVIVLAGCFGRHDGDQTYPDRARIRLKPGYPVARLDRGDKNFAFPHRWLREGVMVCGVTAAGETIC